MAHIRLALADDAKAIIDIFKQYIETPITLEYEVPALIDVVSRIESISKNYPCLVVEDDSGIVGYAFAHRNLDQMGLSWNAEVKAYIDLNKRGNGYGYVLMDLIVKILALQGVYNVSTSITEENPRSMSLHTKLGFVKTGILPKFGFKNGRWLDMHIFQKRICDNDGEPDPFVPMKNLDEDKLLSLVKEANAKLK